MSLAHQDRSVMRRGMGSGWLGMRSGHLCLVFVVIMASSASGDGTHDRMMVCIMPGYSADDGAPDATLGDDRRGRKHEARCSE